MLCIYSVYECAECFFLFFNFALLWLQLYKRTFRDILFHRQVFLLVSCLLMVISMAQVFSDVVVLTVRQGSGINVFTIGANLLTFYIEMYELNMMYDVYKEWILTYFCVERVTRKCPYPHISCTLYILLLLDTRMTGVIS